MLTTTLQENQELRDESNELKAKLAKYEAACKEKAFRSDEDK